MSGSYRATFQANGINIAYATIPMDYSISSQIIDRWQHDFVPFSTFVKAISPNNKIKLYSSGRTIYDDYVNSFQKSLVLKSPNVIKSSIREYIEPIKYLTDYAIGLVNKPVKLLNKSHLASYYGENLDQVKAEQYQFFKNHSININVQIEIASHCVDAILLRFETEINDEKYYILTGMDFRGFEFYDALRANVFNSFGGLFNKKANSNTPYVFGHSKEAGKKVDVIQWGFDRIYACVYSAECEEEALSAYKNFVSSFTIDQNLENRFNQLVDQRFYALYQQSMQMANMATQMQMNANMFAQQTSRNISNQMNSISSGIMDSWDKKMASDTRISNNFSEAIRGVNTYTDTNGQSFEFSNQADHVYTNKYGDHFGVSGNAFDQDILNKMDWTEATKK